MMNTPQNPNAPVAEIPENTNVYDVAGEKVGHVSFSAMRDGFFVVEKGWLFTHQLYIPATAILANDANGITLRLSKEELKDDRWKQAPEAAASDVAVAQSPDYADAAMPQTEEVIEEEEVVVLPPDGVRPLPGDPVLPPTDEAHLSPFTPDAPMEPRLLPPDEEIQDRVFSHNAGDMRPLPADNMQPMTGEPTSPAPAQEQVSPDNS